MGVDEYLNVDSDLGICIWYWCKFVYELLNI